MKNIRVLVCLFMTMWLCVSCLGLEDSAPSSMSMPQVKTFEVKDNGSLVFELSASVDPEMTGRIAGCGFYYGKDKSMSDAEKIECEVLDCAFSAYVTLCEYGETFYVCSYVSNGTEGDEVLSEVKDITLKEFDEYVDFGVPSVVSYNNATKTASICVSYIVAEGVEVSEIGLCYGVTPVLSVDGSHMSDESIVPETVTYEIPQIETGKVYYVRPYLYSGEILEYGDMEEIFVVVSPIVRTASVTNVNDMSAVCGGTIVDTGGDEISAKGVVWSTVSNPTIALSTKTNQGNGSDAFTSTLTGLLPGTRYYVRAYAKNKCGTSYGNEVSFMTTGQPIEFMKAANSFVVSESGGYAFKPFKGNSSQSVGSVNSVEVLWESFGTSAEPRVGDLIESVSWNGSYIIFRTSSLYREGNAVIAAKDASGTILWSWHIWLTDIPQNCYYNNVAVAVMDRNLGATSSAPGDVGALGLIYQWGRKDPFLGSSSIRGNVDAASTIMWPEYERSSFIFGDTIDYAIENPTTFITYNYSNYDWYDFGSGVDNTRWQSSKTIYDPCPAGWRVPDGGSKGVWLLAGFAGAHSYNTSSEGMLFSSESSPAAWYPAAGYRDAIDGELYCVGEEGYSWTLSPSYNNAYCLVFNDSDYVYCTDYNSSRANGFSVRCVQE